MSDDIWRRDDDWERKPLFDDDDDRSSSRARDDAGATPPRGASDRRSRGGSGADGGDEADRPLDDYRFSIDEFAERSSGDAEPDDFATTEFEAVRRERARARRDEPMSFGDSDSEELPHWTQPPTGQVPEIRPVPRPTEADEPDVWASFSTESAVWSDDAAAEPGGPGALGDIDDFSGQVRVRPIDDGSEYPTGEGAAVPPRAPERISIGTDPSGMPRRSAMPEGRARPGPAAESGGRNLPVAIAMGFAIAAIFIAAILWRPAAVVALITVLLGLAAVEFYDKVGEKGYRPAVIPAILAVMAAPLTAYWVGAPGLPLVMAFALIAVAGGFIGARGIEAGPLPNTSISMLGVIWIGLMGSFAALILGFSNVGAGTPWGTDTLVLLAIGVVANDVGAYFIGSAAGRTPLRPWISPGKTVEGFIGGTLFTVVVLVVAGITERSDTWSSTAHLLLLAVVIAIFAPMGDLVESMFKRNLDIKDFGTLVRGHGGVLDRFDGFFFTLPTVYYLSLVLEPWAV